MRIFQSEHAVLFGEPIRVPLGRRPAAAEFTMGRARAGFSYALSWRRKTGAEAYHVFRSTSVATIRERSMERFWHGSYVKEVRHFMLAFPDVDLVVDDYGSRGAPIMYYWVLAQLAGGHLVEVAELVVSIADTHVLDQAHFCLKPGGGFVADQSLRPSVRPYAQRRPTVSKPEPAPMLITSDEVQIEDLVDLEGAPPPARSRIERSKSRQPNDRRSSLSIEFSRFISPGGFTIIEPVGTVAHYAAYIGPAIPDETDQEAMWRDIVYDSNPMERFQLEPTYTGFRDDVHRAGAVSYGAVLAFMADQTVCQVDIALSHNIDSLATLA